MFDPTAFIQPPGSPVEWAALNQRSRDGTAAVIADGQHQRQAQGNADIQSRQNEDQLDETQRAHMAMESDRAAQLELQEREFAQKKEAAKQKRRAEYFADRAKIEELAENKEDMNAGVRGLSEAYGYSMVPGDPPDEDPSLTPMAPDGMEPAPGVPVDAGYDDAMGGLSDSLQKLPSNYEDGDMTPINNSADPDASMDSFRQAVIADGDNLGVTGTGAKGVPKIPKRPMTEEDFKTLELELQKPPVDLEEIVKGQDAAENEERFAERAAQIKALRITSPEVEGAALNQLADALGQPRVAPTFPAPHPLAPPEAHVTPDGMIPEEALEIIDGARSPADDVASGLVASSGNYYVVDDEGNVVSRGNMWQERRDARVAGRLDWARQSYAHLEQGSDDYSKFDAAGQAYAQARTPEEAKHAQALLLQLVQDEAKMARTERQSAYRAASNERADAGADLSRIREVRNTIEGVVQKKTSDMEFKKWASRGPEIDQVLEILKQNKIPTLEQRTIIKKIMVAAEGRSPTAADEKGYMASSLGVKFDELMEELAGDASFSDKRLDDVRKVTARQKELYNEKMGMLADDIYNSVVSIKTLRDLGLSEEEIKDHAEAQVAQNIPGVKYVPKRNGKVQTEKRTRTSSSRSESGVATEADLEDF